MNAAITNSIPQTQQFSQIKATAAPTLTAAQRRVLEQTKFTEYDDTHRDPIPFPTREEPDDDPEPEELDEAQRQWYLDHGVQPNMDQESQAETQIDTLLRLGEQAELFRTPSGALYARVPVGDHHETVPIRERGAGLRSWLVYQYYQETRQTPSANAIARTMEKFAADAQFSGGSRDVHVRAAYHNDAIYLDLANEARQAVKITAQGWEVVNTTPMYFRRPNGLLPLPVPVRGGSLDEMRPFFNVRTDDEWLLFVAWQLGTLHPTGPYPILAINGESGAAKTSASRYARSVVDPNMAPTRKPPKDTESLLIAASSSLICTFDNLSGMSAELADDLCRLATGGGLGTRTLYTNDEETIFSVKRPVVFNGIEELTTRPDLASRCIMLTLKGITDSERKTEK